MRGDRTLKIILTVIAISLVTIVIELASLTPVNANNSVIDVNIRQVNGRTIYDGVPVEITKWGKHEATNIINIRNKG